VLGCLLDHDVIADDLLKRQGFVQRNENPVWIITAVHSMAKWGAAVTQVQPDSAHYYRKLATKTAFRKAP